MHRKALAIIGAGKLGVTLAQLAIKAGYVVYIAGSGNPSKIALTVDVLAPGAVAATRHDAVQKADIVILAVPLGKFRQIGAAELAGKLVVDAMNYWWEVDGAKDELVDEARSSSETVQAYFQSARIVKALNHMGYHHLHDETRPAARPGRKAIAIAGDAEDDVRMVTELVNALGFDPVVIGSLAAGRSLEPGTESFGANVDAKILESMIAAYNSHLPSGNPSDTPVS